ncbi:MAG: PIG-L family deacetylase [Ignavibacteria bacterium]|nr:PIG-L family deacetylase [Ignavibacteria bacterium]MBT8383788.1 PIG-L family deacetylase [Ignavibacteria bacterium]MBT8390712.1 PIG-L family deacetylase [Ignavibacteria bacterium]NNJ53665.1 PIG-L family deacetylase [Ignavibacteriaceae bacterium]NNL22515.1 PIG-L family deacetylase [Ignavibacteriaceae bacterium]
MIKKIFLLILTISFSVLSQPKETLSSSEIKLALKKLNTLGSVLYIAAHPDDENTAFLSYSNFGKLLRTGYLSLTRGDGGQNLIGDEQSDLLGVLRTEELLQARYIDGAEQYFSRAIDFGYSKTAKETFIKWGKEEILSDVVWVIRKFKPDIIVTRFPITGEGRHGQHTASAILALEAFNISNDANIFPEQLKYVEPWQPKRIFWNAWTPALKSMGIESDTLIKINLGEYNQLLGRSYTEISAESRTMHKSQGFGDSGWRQHYYNYFLQMDGEYAKKDIFEGINISWSRVDGSGKVSSLLKKAEEQFSFEDPENIIPLLVEAYFELQNINHQYWVEQKSSELLQVIKSCAGIWTEAVTDEYNLTNGSNYNIEAGIVNRSDVPFVIKDIEVSYQQDDSLLNSPLQKGEMIKVQKVCYIPDELNYTHPYWLNSSKEKDIHSVNDQSLIGLAKKKSQLIATFTLEYKGKEIKYIEPVYFRENDPVKGEVYRSVEIVPPVVVNFNKDLYTVANGINNQIAVKIKCLDEKASGKVKINPEEGWIVSPEYYEFNLNSKNEELNFEFIVQPISAIKSSKLTAEILVDGKTFNRSLHTIEYPHIQTQTVTPIAKTKIVKIDLGKRVVNKIGYIMGSGDKIPTILSDLGYDVQVFNDESLAKEQLKNFDVIITGIRAYNTNSRLKISHQLLMNYIKNGGTLITQYNTFRDLHDELGPYELTISRERVTEEGSPVKILDAKHPLLNFPNKITEEDFSGWIQERGLYFPGEWSEEYQPLLEMNDTNSEPLRGSILYCKFGKGNFIYTGLSFFRQLPAGVTGAYNLFTNLISAGKN